ncbi:MAG: sialate O-acetylesterase [Gammaproteobacteria bacterium]|nr:sialate O-acetylesterase [Gammaproteobacteria bacterium]
MPLDPGPIHGVFFSILRGPLVDKWGGGLVFTDELSGTISLTTSVASNQVYQRNGAGIAFAGTYNFSGDDPTTIMYRVGSSQWKQLSSETIGSGNWSGTATFSNGYGQGNLEFKPLNGESITAASVANITLTDIFAVNGQSNADGFATNLQTYTKTTYDWKTSVNGGAWSTETTDPTWNSDGSFWPALAELFDQAGKPPAFVSGVTIDGTGFITNDWNDGDVIHEQAVTRLDGALAASGGCAGHLWIQAEADANGGQTQAGYEAAFIAMLDAFDADITNFVGTPTFVTLLGRRGTASAIDAVRRAIQDIWDGDSRSYSGPNLIAEEWGDNIHYGIVGGGLDTAAAAAQLDRVASYHKRCVDAVLFGGSVPARGAQISSLSIGIVDDANKITVTFDRGMANHTDETGWSVIDSEGTRTVSSAAQGVSSDIVVLTCDQALYGATTVSFGEGNTNAVGATLADTHSPAFPPDYAYRTSAGTGPGEAPNFGGTVTFTNGAMQEGQALTGDTGSPAGVPDPSETYAWLRDDVAISGATNSTYTLVSADIGAYIKFRVSLSSATGTAEETSAAQGPVVEQDETQVFLLAADGTSTGLTEISSTINTAQTDPDSGSNAVSWIDQNPGSVGQCAVRCGNTVFNNGVNIIRAKFKTISSEAADMWIRVWPQNMSVGDNVSILITDDATPDGSRVGTTGAGWGNVSVTSLGSGWFQFYGEIDLTGADVTGLMRLMMGDADNDSTVDRQGTNEVALHDFEASYLNP